MEGVKFDKLMYEENNRDPRTEEAEVVNKEVNCVSREEVKNALRKMKKGKAVGPDELPVSLEVHEKDGDKVFDQIVQQTVNG